MCGVGHSARVTVPNTYLKPDGAEAEIVDHVGSALQQWRRHLTK